MSLKAFHIVFIVFSTLLALGTSGWCMWVDLVVGGPICVAGSCDCADVLRIFVLAEDETATNLHMKRVGSLLLVSVLFAAQQALSCPFCYGAKDGKSTEHMAVAIWFLFGAVMSVMGGIG